MPSKKERFAVRICGCCRDLDFMQVFIAESRVQAVQIAERIGPLDNRGTARMLLEGSEGPGIDSFYLYSPADKCRSTGAPRHAATVWKVTE
jgi:hypothetical protein